MIIDSSWGPFTYIYLIKSFENERGGIISLILEMQKLHLQEVKWFNQGHIFIKYIIELRTELRSSQDNFVMLEINEIKC